MTDILAIVGSCEFEYDHWQRVTEALIGWYIREHRPEEIISGESPKGGVDLVARAAAAHFGIPFRPFPPTNHRWDGPGGYAERNTVIADTCTRLLRVACKHATTYGSGWTHDEAARRGKATREYLIDRHGVLSAGRHHPGRTVRPIEQVDLLDLAVEATP